MATDARRKTFSGTNRPRKATKQGVQRYDNGRIVNRDLGEKPEDVLRVGVNARARHLGLRRDVVREDASIGRLGSVLGRLAFTKELSARQEEAAKRYAKVVTWNDLLDDVRPGYGIPAAARAACTFGRDPYEGLDPDFAWDSVDEKRRRDLIAKIRRDYADVRRVMWEMEAQVDTRGGGAILARVVMWDDDSVVQKDAARGTLRCACNVLANLWGLAEHGG